MDAAQKIGWKNSDEGLDRYNERLRAPLGPTPIAFPYRALWQFGGFARIVTPGLLVTVVGMAGGMKTGFVECLIEAWRKMDFWDALWWGTEWSWEKMADRAIQRGGGPTVEEMALHSLWLHEEKQNKPTQARLGVRMSDQLIRKAEVVTETIKGWPGMSHMTETVVSDLDDLLEAQHERIADLEASGREVRFCVWDYLQLLNLKDNFSESERLSSVMGKLQLFCSQHQVVGITASQVTKGASYAAKKEGEVLTAESGQNFRSDKPQLVLTLRPIYKGGLITDEAEINVDKNNAGRTGTTRVQIDPARYKWIDTK